MFVYNHRISKNQEAREEKNMSSFTSETEIYGCLAFWVFFFFNPGNLAFRTQDAFLNFLSFWPSTHPLIKIYFNASSF